MISPLKAIQSQVDAQQSPSTVSEDCRSRSDIIGVASSYFNNTTYLSSYHINDNSDCSERVKPRYLGNAGVYPSVPYAWGISDDLEQFNEFMSGGINGMFAGNTNKLQKSCARGIDCSGLVSRAWGLSDPHLGTCSLPDISTQLASVNLLHYGDIMNLCQGNSGHTIIFVEFDGPEKLGMFGYEALAEIDSDRVVIKNRSFGDLAAAGYVPRKYNNACFKVKLPVIHNSSATDLSNSTANPYPSPNLDVYNRSYPYPSPNLDTFSSPYP